MLDTLIKGGTIIDGRGGDRFVGDVGIKDGVIAELGGNITSAATQMVDADGAIVTPGFVDIHTHFDGQVSWDDTMDPSFSHGVTSIVMGNCGVGFAPVPPGGEKELIEVMEGVEDIPGTALYEGIPWGTWESFPEYLDHIDGREYTLDIGTQIAHGAVRNYVMDQRGRENEPASDDDLAKMKQIVAEALDAGALGFSTSRTIGHRDIRGRIIPGTHAAKEEMLAFADVLKDAGRGVFELIPAGTIGDLEYMGGEQTTYQEEVELLAEISKRANCPVTFTLVQNMDDTKLWKEVLKTVENYNQSGTRLHPQVSSRPIGVVTSLQSYHMFQRRETFLKMAHLPFEQILSEMRKPEVREAILADKDVPHEYQGSMTAGVHLLLQAAFRRLYEIEHPVDYEPTEDKCFEARAKAAGQSQQEFMYDFLVGGDGKRFAIVLGSNYYEQSHDCLFDMIMNKHTVTGLSDAGAHVNMIFDGVAGTYQMMHWARDRKRGPRIPLEHLVYKQTYNNANLYGLNDRGSIELGKRADINIIDHDRLALGPLGVFNDLPAGGSRILQNSIGYVGTFVKGVQTRAFDEDTGARPGRLIRG